MGLAKALPSSMNTEGKQPMAAMQLKVVPLHGLPECTDFFAGMFAAQSALIANTDGVPSSWMFVGAEA